MENVRRISTEGLTMKRVIAEARKSRQTQPPHCITKIDDLIDWSKKVGFTYEFMKSSRYSKYDNENYIYEHIN